MPRPKSDPTLPKNPGGQPKAQIDYKELEKLCVMQCTLIEIAAFFGVSKQTILNRQEADPEMYACMERGRAKGRISVRRAQLRMLEAGNATMGVWLGKQLLGQRDVEREERQEAATQVAKVEVEWIVPQKPEPSADELPMIHFPANGDSTRAN